MRNNTDGISASCRHLYPIRTLFINCTQYVHFPIQGFLFDVGRVRSHFVLNTYTFEMYTIRTMHKRYVLCTVSLNRVTSLNRNFTLFNFLIVLLLPFIESGLFVFEFTVREFLKLRKSCSDESDLFELNQLLLSFQKNKKE